jgi:hypothetical protein
MDDSEDSDSDSDKDDKNKVDKEDDGKPLVDLSTKMGKQSV